MNRILLVALLGLAAINPTFSAKADAGSTISLKLMTEELGAPIGLVPIPDGSGRLLVAGGYVYRGKAIPALVGKYIFADW